MPLLKSVAMLLICCCQLPIAVQTLFAYASFAFVSELAAAAARRDESQGGEHSQHRHGGGATAGVDPLPVESMAMLSASSS